MNRFKVGLLGTGGIAARHAAAMITVADRLQLVACCGRSEIRVAEFAARFGIRPYCDFDRMLTEQHLDLLIVALPPDAHTGQVETAAAAGVNLLVEKPIALTMARAGSMLEAVTKAGVVAACGFMYRFGEAVRRWDLATANGETGRAGMFVGQFHSNSLHADWWREKARSGGQLIEQLIHIVDLARHQLGEPQFVYARGSNFFHGGVERYDSDDVSAMILGYDDGRVGVLNATNAAVPGVWDKRWQVIAERMTGHFSGWNSAVLTHTTEPVKVEHVHSETDVFAAQLADVAMAIAEHRRPQVPLIDGVVTLRIALAAAQSAAQGREIAL